MRRHISHVDHLNTPRLVASSSGTTVWRWDQMEPFGVNTADEDPDGNSVAFEFPLGFPGQYRDKDTNLHYNYFRDYDAGIGRYVQSDLIGLLGGLNTYAYVNSSPLTALDPFGLAKIPGWPQGLPEPPLSDDKMRPLTKEQLDRLYKELRKRNLGPEANKVKRYQKAKLIRKSSLKRGIGIMCILGIVDEYCRLNPSDPACIIVNPPEPPDPNDPCKGDPNCI